MSDGLADYFSDYWNVLDSISIILNMFVIVVCTISYFYESKEIFDITLVRTFGAYGAFIMWLKMFYWMRLFSPTAKYVQLII